MTLKYFIIFILIVVMIIPQAKAQLGLGILDGLLGSANIQGTVLCTAEDNVDVKGGIIPVFPNAHVQLLCGEKEFSNTRTDDDGKFSITMDPLPLLLDLSSLLNGCNIVITTPLSNCNVKLPSAGRLISTLQFVGINHIGTTQTIANIIPSGFHFIPST